MLFLLLLKSEDFLITLLTYSFHELEGKFQDKYHQGKGTIILLYPHILKIGIGSNPPGHLASPMNSVTASFLGHQSITSPTQPLGGKKKKSLCRL